MATTIGQSFKVGSYENIKMIYSHQLSLDHPFQCFHFFVDLKSKMASTTGHFFYESMSENMNKNVFSEIANLLEPS
jgi:hypothetical protein